MDYIKYRMYKNNTLYHEGTCPSFLFSGVVPLEAVDVNNVYDYMIIEFNGKTKTYNREEKTQDWKF